MGKQPSIQDIAKKLNISVTTVSFILNGKAQEKRISTALAKKVLKLADEIGYVANHLARSLRTGKTHILGLLVEDIANPFFANVAGEIEDIANQKGYRIFYCSSKNDTEKSRQLIKIFEERQVDGYIITPVNGIEDKIRSLLEDKSKLVLFDRYFPEIDTNYVVVDNEKGGYEATDHLLQQGYKNIAFVTIESKQTQMLGRLAGYKKALAEKRIRPLVKRIAFNENVESMINDIADFFKEKKKIDAVFFGTNYLGVAGLEAINRLQLKIPSQLAVVSFDDHDLFRLHQPSITAMAQPIKKMSELLINILLESLDGKQSLPNSHVVIPPRLIVRQSSAAKH